MEGVTILAACVLGAAVAGYSAYRKYFSYEEKIQNDGTKANVVQQKESISHSSKQVVNLTEQTSLSTETSKVRVKISYAFSKANQHPEEKLIKVINNAKSKLDIAIYSITDDMIVNPIINAFNRGVNVRIITDNEKSKDKWERKAIIKLYNAGIPIKVSQHEGSMHLKMTIADDSIVTTGSYNYSYYARTKNAEVLVVMDDKEIASGCVNQFESMWSDWRNYIEYTQRDSFRTTA